MSETRCDHNWEPGDVYSDWICSECGERADIPDYDDQVGKGNYIV